VKDKANNGQVDPDRDHHFINGRMVPVVERPPTRAQKARAKKGNQRAKGGKAAEDAPSQKA
jgi:hypothetical protein